jgi:hypothetical protein
MVNEELDKRQYDDNLKRMLIELFLEEFLLHVEKIMKKHAWKRNLNGELIFERT